MTINNNAPRVDIAQRLIMFVCSTMWLDPDLYGPLSLASAVTEHRTSSDRVRRIRECRQPKDRVPLVGAGLANSD
jgi:hypothetical protein